jgi:hypothetical protein
MPDFHDMLQCFCGVWFVPKRVEHELCQSCRNLTLDVLSKDNYFQGVVHFPRGQQIDEKV